MIDGGGVIAQAGQRILHLVERLAGELGLLKRAGRDLAAIGRPDQTLDLAGGAVGLGRHLFGDLVEAVDDPPSEPVRDPIQPGVAQQIEQRRHHHLDRVAPAADRACRR
jgi:hypothetical protein